MPVDIILIAGQSNAAGRGSLETVPNFAALGYDDPYPAVQYRYMVEDTPTDPLVWDSDVGPEDLQPMPGGNAGIIGVEISLGRKLTALGRSVAIAKMAIGSSLLHTHWKAVGSAYPTAAPHLFTQLITFAGAVETSLSGTIRELVWIQGESDAGNSAAAAAYAANFAVFMSTFRTTFPGIPVTINRLHYLAGGTFNSTVRTQQDLAARSIPGVRIFGVDDLDLIGAHFTAPAYITLGDRFASAIVGSSSIFGLAGGLRAGIVGGPLVGPCNYGGGAGSSNFPPVAEFTNVPTGLSVAFTDTSSDLEAAVASWRWNFGDGATSTSQNPTHVYGADGTYSVTLTVTDSGGATASVTHSVSVMAAQWTVDASSNIATPVSSAEWTAFLAANPSLGMSNPGNLWLFQEASGNLADAIGGKTLTMSGSPTYQASETGWARKFVKASGSAANQFASNGTMTNTATTSVLLIAFARIVQPVLGHQRMFYGGASSDAFEGIALSPNIRLRTGGNAGNGTLDHTGQVRPYVLIHDVTNSVNILYSNIEKKSVTFGAAAGSSVQFQFGLLTDITVDTRFGYGAAWSGSAAEFGNAAATDAKIKALLQALGFTVSGY